MLKFTWFLTIIIAKKELNLHVENQCIWATSKTEREIKYIYWTVTENQKRNVQKVELSVFTLLAIL